MQIRIVRHSDVAACPILSLDVDHFRDDGSCRCFDPAPEHGTEQPD